MRNEQYFPKEMLEILQWYVGRYDMICLPHIDIKNNLKESQNASSNKCKQYWDNSLYTVINTMLLIFTFMYKI